jgi:16S rRNA (guanine527-N7)-methyltransferase
VFAEILKAKTQSFIGLSASQIHLLEKHFLLLQRWNQKLNLTSLKSPEEIVERHYAESLFLGAHLPSGYLNIVDIGSGAGFPGIPVAALRPECAITLVESHQRKSVFLREATRDLSNVTVSAERIEEVEGKFDWAVSRAVRFEDIEKAVFAKAERVGLLAADVSPGQRCFTWNEPVRLPWGLQRFLWIGTRST